MKQYIKENWKPLLIGYAITLTFYHFLDFLEGTIMKILILINK